MAIFRCKMCGGDLDVVEGTSYCTCEFCGRQQTIPTVKDEGLQTLFNRANVLRMKSEFDKAADVYEKILQRSETEAEAYWGLILCKYGIEYVEDPVSFKRVPTCHRASYDAVTADEDYQNALKYADATQKEIYEAEAAAIDEIQRGIIALAQKEDPYDVFICYKETDSEGKRTQDSVVANDVYHQLTMEGFKVFYAAITLEDKLGTEYEPYIFSALNSAKVMLVLGTKPEYFNAVWVKNEWSRFLKIMQKDRSKLLIPCYRDMDPYELPEEFAHLQAQDMSKIGFINDLIRGIKKVLEGTSARPATKETVVVQNGAGTTAAAQIKRGNMALEDGEWAKADSFFEEALNLDPESGAAYLGQFLAAQKCKTDDEYAQRRINATAEAKAETLTACAEDTGRINACITKNKVEGYLAAEEIWNLFTHQRTYSSSETSRKQQLNDEINSLNNQKLLNRASQFGAQAEVDTLKEKILSVMRGRLADSQLKARQNKENAIAAHQSILEEAEKKASQLHEKALQKKAAEEKDAAEKIEAERVEKERKAEEKRLCDYDAAVSKKKKAQTSDAMTKAFTMFDILGDYRDSQVMAEECKQLALQLRESENRQAAAAKKKDTTVTIIVLATIAACVAAYIVLASVIIPNNKYNEAMAFVNQNEIIEGYEALVALDGYKDSEKQAESIYEQYRVEKLKIASVGDIVVFGAYEQDNNTSNEKEDIEWLVLATEDDKALVISRYALDCQPYNITYEDITWEDCTLRDWLNDEFLNSAFSDNEQSMIPDVMVSADKNLDYNTDIGNDTTDRIFLLSVDEVKEYFTSAETRTCVPTDYAVAQGAFTSNRSTNGGVATCWWWLRSSSVALDNATLVYCGGLVGCNGGSVSRGDVCVRPAMWINLDA